MPLKPSKSVVKNAEKALKNLRERCLELKKDESHPDFESKMKRVREDALNIYRSTAGLVTKFDLDMFGIIIKKTNS